MPIYELSQFKSTMKIGQIEVKKNPATGKIFAVLSNGDCMKIQQDFLVSTKPRAIVITGQALGDPDFDLDECCIAKADEGLETLAVL